MGDSELEKYTVTGHSMYPLLRDGEEVTVYPAKKYEVGDIVVAKHPFLKDTLIIKEISAIENEQYRLKSIGEGNTQFGPIKQEDIIGKFKKQA
jgi:phage repressor protein C with HTH and peptisase S24 domain